MKKKLIIVILIVIFISFANHSVLACSSFAVYADKPYYGMNFDYAVFPMKFTIANTRGIKSFHLWFQRPVGENETLWVETAGMNSMGLFAAIQEEHPYQVDPPQPGENDIYVHQLYEGLYSAKSVNSIIDICSVKKMIQLNFVSVHTLFADINGNAFVAEAEKNENSLTHLDGRFILMTNFPNRSLKNKPYTTAQGKGDRRYIAGYEFLNKNSSVFSIKKGMETLELMKNRDANYPTCCSMVFDPNEKKIYIALNTNYQKLFKVSLEEEMISTFRGFSTEKRLKIGADGIRVSELRKL